jgi:hypothetical protein
LAAQILHHHLKHTHIVVYREDNWLAHASLVYCLRVSGNVCTTFATPKSSPDSNLRASPCHFRGVSFPAQAARLEITNTSPLSTPAAERNVLEV